MFLMLLSVYLFVLTNTCIGFRYARRCMILQAKLTKVSVTSLVNITLTIRLNYLYYSLIHDFLALLLEDENITNTKQRRNLNPSADFP